MVAHNSFELLVGIKALPVGAKVIFIVFYYKILMTTSLVLWSASLSQIRKFVGWIQSPAMSNQRPKMVFAAYPLSMMY